jgi:hypothetical protein
MGRYDALTHLEQTPEPKTPVPEASSPPPPPLPASQAKKKHIEQKRPVPALRQEKTLDTSLLTTKEKTKYGTYLTDESIEKISIRAIQVKRDSHQIVQEAINQYFERLEK